MPRFAELSPSRQRLVRILQQLNFGELQDVQVSAGEAVIEATFEVIVDLKLDAGSAPRQEQNLQDFELREELLRLFECLDDLKDGTIQRLEIRAGIPRRVVIRSRFR